MAPWALRLRRLVLRRWVQLKAAYRRPLPLSSDSAGIAATRRAGAVRQRFWDEVKEGRRIADEHARTGAARGKPGV
jgi:hypothetical protein